jgi:light-harvesting complex 1 beta chain
MAISTHPSSAPRGQHLAKEDFRAFYGIFAVSFVLFFAIALMAEALGWQWRSWLPGAERVESLTGGVKAAVYTFMSHLL